MRGLLILLSVLLLLEWAHSQTLAEGFYKLTQSTSFNGQIVDTSIIVTDGLLEVSAQGSMVLISLDVLDSYSDQSAFLTILFNAGYNSEGELLLSIDRCVQRRRGVCERTAGVKRLEPHRLPNLR